MLAVTNAFAQVPPSWHVWPTDVDKARPPAPPAPQAPVKPSADAAIPETDHSRLGRAIVRKFENPGLAAARAKRDRLPPPSHSMAEELPIREIRARIALARPEPAGVTVLAIPAARTPPTLDGMVDSQEWREALRIALEPADRRAIVLAMAHGGRIYLAGQAPGDRTATGFDQFRFWFHLGLSPYLTNERVFMSSNGSTNALRGARVPVNPGVFPHAPAPGTLRDDVDWYVYSRTQGASVVAGFRQYEMSIDLAEAGLAPGVPFPAYFEIEGDPIYEADKFKARVMEGQAGSQQRPLWLRIAR